MEKKCTCKLCGNIFQESEMSEEHYPARSVGNNDIVALNIIKMIDSMQSGESYDSIERSMKKGMSLEDAAGNYFDQELAEPLYPHGRTARTLCRQCNTFLGKYDEAYLKFYNSDGDPKIVKGFQRSTKLQIIKAIFAKFLSVPETSEEKFDFLDFIKDQSMSDYNGQWHLYFVRRDFRSDLMGLTDIGTGKEEYDEGIVYEMSDDKFIFNLLSFKKHDCYEMNNIFDILKKDYKLVIGTGDQGGYHAEILMGRLFSQMYEDSD